MHSHRDSFENLPLTLGSSLRAFVLDCDFWVVHAVSSCHFEFGVVFCAFHCLVLLDTISFFLFGCCIFIFILLDALHTLYYYLIPPWRNEIYILKGAKIYTMLILFS